MNYVNYDTSIVIKYKAQLVGWPSTIKFGNPSTIGTVDDIRTLHTALQVGSCKWIILTVHQQAAHLKSVEALREAGTVVGKKRKVHLDKGKQRKGTRDGKRTPDEGGEDEEEEDEEDVEVDHVAKRRRAAAVEDQVAKKKQEKFAAHPRRKRVFPPKHWGPKSQVPPLPKSQILVDSDYESDSNSD
jgi:hypothetical protein